MIFFCPRCRLPLTADVPPGRATRLTCPACLELITVHPPAPVPVIPIDDQPPTDRPLDYRALSGDVEVELQKDMRAVLWGIIVFAATAVIGYLVLKTQADLPGPMTYWFGWIGIVTTLIALAMIGRHARRSRKVRAGTHVRMKSTGERVVSIVVLGITGLLLIGLTILAAAVLLFAACLVMVAGNR
ncbi:MAG: hypothetical protein QOF78_644 [Phycisphaerales bacterium]|jgi:hypothetical protein|nr:hypothetical protein [Phycisphaerales bacterium]